MRRVLSAALVVATALAASATDGGAQCIVPPSSNEARLLAFFMAPIAFTPDAAPHPLAAGSVEISGEAVYIPTPSDEIRNTSRCFTQKSESADIARIFPRPRITVGLGYGLAIEASYLPPVTVEDATPNLGSAALSWTHALGWLEMGGGTGFVMLRGAGTRGTVKGPITCPEDALQQTDAGSPCYGDRPSRDTFHPDMLSAEGALSWWSQDTRLGAYLGASYGSLKPRFQVGFTDLTGNVDNTRVQTDLTRFGIFGGGTVQITRAIGLSAQLYSVPQDVTTIRAAVRYILR